MKIIIYAAGKLLRRYREKINWSMVIALADRNPKDIDKIYSIPIISPEEISMLDYDYIVIFSDQLYEEIRMELTGKFFVCQDKIIPWREIVSENHDIEVLETYQTFFKENGCKRILDIGMSVLAKACLYKEEISSGKKMIIDGIWSKSAICNVNIYNRIYKTYQECKEKYDAILVWPHTDKKNIHLEILKKKARYIIMHTGYLDGKICVREYVYRILQRYGKVTCISNYGGIFWAVDTKADREIEDISIYVVIHKKYNTRSDEVYRSLCVGDYQKKGCLTENSGENIGYLNKKINECTALYWIWKNTDTKYVGMNHYRRYFYNNEIESMDNYLDMDHIAQILNEYDIILAKRCSMRHMTVLEQLYNSMDYVLCHNGYFLLRDMLKKHQPQYIQAFDDVMNGHSIFPCNIFVTKREILDKYCEWLFSFLIEAAEKIDTEGYDSYSQRVIGFFAERMWTVWLRRNKFKIKELPYTVIR